MTKNQSQKSSAPVPRRTPKNLSSHLYAYVTPANEAHAKGFGKRNFGSFSKYINTLITLDRKDHMTAPVIEELSKSKKSKEATA